MVNRGDIKVDYKFPHCAVLANGGFVIAYVTTYWAREYNLVLKIYDKDGNLLTDEIRVTTIIVNPLISITPLTTGGFVITYTSVNHVVYYILGCWHNRIP
jgi:hypothetical protein